MFNWILVIVLPVVVTGYCIMQFKRSRDRWYVGVLALTLTFTAAGILTLLSQDNRLLGIPWETLRDSYFALVALLILYYSFRALWPHPFLGLSRSYAKALDLRARGDIRHALQITRQLVVNYPR